jgi:hypothetical protein
MYVCMYIYIFWGRFQTKGGFYKLFVVINDGGSRVRVVVYLRAEGNITQLDVLDQVHHLQRAGLCENNA